MLASAPRHSNWLARLTAGFGVASLAAYGLAQVALAANTPVRILTANSLLGGASFVATGLLLLATRAAARISRRAGLAWGLLAAAQACSLLGDVIGSRAGLAAAGQNMPALTLVSYWAYYPLFIAGLLLLPHAAPQAWNPALQVNPQLVPSHVGVEFAGGAHAEQALPHVALLLLLTHAPPQAWNPALHVNPHTPAAQRGAPLPTPGHTFGHEPQ